MEGLKQERLILPSADTLERAGLAGRARARKAAAALMSKAWVMPNWRGSMI